MLTFRKHWQDKIISGEKQQTIRKNVDWWMENYKKGCPLHIYCPNPRFGNGKFLGVTRDWFAFKCNGIQFSELLAIRDGFEDLTELYSYFNENLGMPVYQLLNTKFAVIRWFNLFPTIPKDPIKKPDWKIIDDCIDRYSEIVGWESGNNDL